MLLSIRLFSPAADRISRIAPRVGKIGIRLASSLRPINAQQRIFFSCNPSQFSEGLSIWSITNTSTGPLAGTSLKPSCS